MAVPLHPEAAAFADHYGFAIERVAAIRRYLNITQEGLAEALQAVGLDWERITVAKLESGRRPFVRVDELLALCLVLEIAPVDLLVPKDLHEDQPYLMGLQ